MAASLARVKVVAVDLDGVVYHGNSLIPGADSAVRRLREMGYRVVFVTNNSARSRASIASKLAGMGVEAREEDVFNSTFAAGLLLRRLSKGKQSYALVLGSEDLKESIRQNGVEVVKRPPAGFLVVGLDLCFSYERISLALEAILGGAIFVACNRDLTYPVERGKLLPGCGAMVAAVEAACGKQPAYYVGKPDTMLLTLLANSMAVAPSEILMVGDTMTSDIVMANRFGSPSAFVAPGLTEVPKDGPDMEPTVTIQVLVELPKLLASARG